ncbi:MAG: SDR family NAD(P)-dependent oxidoreductase [Myxococcota bacterium]
MHVVITGASTGIGEGLARAWARKGASLTLVSRRRAALDALAASLGTPCHVVAADLADPAQATAWLAGAEAALGPVDVLVNNAGVQIVGPTETIPPEQAEALLRLDLLAPLALVRAVAPGLLARGRGAVVNVSSLAALAPTPGMAHYNAAKAGLAAFSESLRGEWRRTGVNVVTVYPGPVRTNLADVALGAYGKLPLPIPFGTVDGLARRVVAAVEGGRGRVVYPAVYAIVRHFPQVTRFVLDLATPRPRLSSSDTGGR